MNVNTHTIHSNWMSSSASVILIAAPFARSICITARAHCAGSSVEHTARSAKWLHHLRIDAGRASCQLCKQRCSHIRLDVHGHEDVARTRQHAKTPCMHIARRIDSVQCMYTTVYLSRFRTHAYSVVSISRRCARVRIPAYERFHTPSIREPMELPVPAAGSCLSRASCSGRAAVVVRTVKSGVAASQISSAVGLLATPPPPFLSAACILQERASVARFKNASSADPGTTRLKFVASRRRCHKLQSFRTRIRT